MASQHKSDIQLYTVDESRAGQRIDNFLVGMLKGVPKSMIYRILRKGEVRVNKGRIKPDYRLQKGDCIRIPPVRVAEPTEAPKASKRAVTSLEEAVLYEDDALIIIDKPAGMAVHGGSGVSLGVIEILRQMRPQERSLELVHRLDRDTSGCLMIAKKRSMLKALHEMLRDNAINKHYLALVKGAWKGGVRRVDVPLMKNILSSGERMVRVDAQGKPALTDFHPLESFEDASLVRVDLGTGRTHQIRVHARHIGRPIAGDPKYGDEDFNAEMRKRGLKRLFLHAEELRFIHPVTGVTLAVQAPLDEELSAVLDGMRQ